MAQFRTHSETNPEFARVIEVTNLRDADRYPFDIEPVPEECAKIAQLLGLIQLRKLRFTGELVPYHKTGWALAAELGATAVQECVVTLDPVTTRIDQSVYLKYIPQRPPAESEVMLTSEDDETIEPLGSEIDLGLAAIEALALALPAYPRTEGATLTQGQFAGTGVMPLSDDDVKPFASLAALRDKLQQK